MNETYRILIISEIQGYMIMSLKEKIQETGYEVSVVAPDVTQISVVRDRIGAYLIYGSEEMGDMQQALIYLKDQSAEQNIPIFTVGSREENEAIGRVIPKHLIRQFFERPVNINELVEAMDTYITKFGAQNKKKILVVDDSGAMLRNVKGWLEDTYQVILANSGAMAIKYLATNRPDLVLLDVMLPDESGYDIVRKLRKNPATKKLPVIMVTAKTAEMDMIKGLDEGADDYIKKPFSIMELITRVKALLRRTETEDIKILQVENITLDHERHMVFVDDKPVELTFKEYELLRLLMTNPSVVLSREVIMRHVWGTEFEGESRTVDMHIKTLRQKLGEAGSKIRTVRNVGYVIE